MHLHLASDPASTFFLKGSTGEERVYISDERYNFLDELTLSTEWKRFQFSQLKWESIIIDFKSDGYSPDGKARDVQFKSKSLSNIVNQRMQVEWKCNSANESSKCEGVRNGNFSWGGKYVINPGKVAFSHLLHEC